MSSTKTLIQLPLSLLHIGFDDKSCSSPPQNRQLRHLEPGVSARARVCLGRRHRANMGPVREVQEQPGRRQRDQDYCQVRVPRVPRNERGVVERGGLEGLLRSRHKSELYIGKIDSD